MIKDSSWIFITVLVIAFDTIYGGRTEAWFVGKCRMFCCLLSIHSCVSQSLKWKTQTLLGKCLSLVRGCQGCVELGAPSLCVTRDGKKMVLGVCFFFNQSVFPQTSRVHILDTETFETTFGPKSQRKRPTLSASDVQSLVENAEASSESYDQGKDRDLVSEDTGVRWLEKKIIHCIHVWKASLVFKEGSGTSISAVTVWGGRKMRLAECGILAKYQLLLRLCPLFCL